MTRALVLIMALIALILALGAAVQLVGDAFACSAAGAEACAAEVLP